MPRVVKSKDLRLLKDLIREVVGILQNLPMQVLIREMNFVRSELHKISPFKKEPVDFVEWVPNANVVANDYNPNTVAPPEMELLALSILQDGYTQPIVSCKIGEKLREVVDGFHRNLIGKEHKEVAARIFGYLPVSTINQPREDRNDRIASTIRHNRARGKHQVAPMSDIVMELKKRNWSDKRVGKELGMDPDEVLRLGQITNLLEAFSDQKFTEAWEPTNDGDTLSETDHTQENEVGFEWCVSSIDDDLLGWVDRTEKSSVLYGDDPKVRGTVQKSKVANHWHWYTYNKPMSSGVAKTVALAKKAVNSYWTDDE